MPIKRKNYNRTTKKYPRYSLKKGLYEAKARRNFEKLIKEVANKDVEKKQFSVLLNNTTENASTMAIADLCDVELGNDNNHRIGNEIVGTHFDVLLSLFNTTNNDLFVRVSLIELEGRGGTAEISTALGLFLDPNGNVTNYTTAVATAANAAVMYQWDTKSSCRVLKEKVYKVAKNNGGSSSSTRTLKWKVPWAKKVRFANPSQQGPGLQNRRVALVTTAWSPNGGSQSTYTYALDGILKFYFKDS